MAELERFTTAGGAALVETTTIDSGRDAERLAASSTASGVHIVMSTGWYRQRWYPDGLTADGPQPLAERMIADVLEGVTGEIRAGAIGEIGFEEDEPPPDEAIVLRAAGMAQRATGAMLGTHASKGPAGISQLDILDDVGVDPARIVIGHADTHLDRAYHEEILRRGAWLAFDTVARVHIEPDEARATHLLHLIDRGWADRLLISSDRCYETDLVASGGAGYAAVLGPFSAMLLERGLDCATLETITIDNPARLLAFEPRSA